MSSCPSSRAWRFSSEPASRWPSRCFLVRATDSPPVAGDWPRATSRRCRGGSSRSLARTNNPLGRACMHRGDSCHVGHVDVPGIAYVLPDGRVLLDGVSFRVGDGAKVALVGDNGSGKTTLLRLIAGDIDPVQGSISRSGGLGVMRQFIGNVRDDSTVRDLLLSVAPPRVRAAAAAVDDIELAMMEAEDEATQLRYASALAEYADAGGYDAEVLWDVCTTTALGLPFDEAKWRD